MGLLDNTTQYDYYEEGEKGGYQFTSLDDIINQFMVAYVGEEKIISKAKRLDVAFHAQRAMQELSFDTFKSIKSQEITLPPSNTMILPHDYVNYTKISWSDSAGIKHPLYPTSNTSNPFKILQQDDGAYDFTLNVDQVFENGDFSSSIGNSPWKKTGNYGSSQGSDLSTPIPQNDTSQGIFNGQYEWKHVGRVLSGGRTTRHFSLWQTINVADVDYITISAKGRSSATDTGKTAGIVRLGFSTQIDLTAQDPNDPGQAAGTDPRWDGYNPQHTNPNSPLPTATPSGGKPSKNMDPTIFDVASLDSPVNYIEFNNGDDVFETLELTDVDVRNLTTVDLLVVSSGGDIGATAALHPGAIGVSGTNAIDDVVMTFEAEGTSLQSGGESTTWSSYKSHTPNDNVDKYDDGTYDLVRGERYGIDPQHAQVNGSYYIDNLRGLINFSSNVSGKTVILDYISDGLGTDGEMQVHKFAEEAMYKWISHAVLASRANTPEYLVNRYKKERFAAIRQAKLRLSNIKLEELTQILRGKSKWIKH